jgi:hypothetical protein
MSQPDQPLAISGTRHHIGFFEYFLRLLRQSLGTPQQYCVLGNLRHFFPF